MGTEASIVMTTVASPEDAALLGDGLVEAGLAACVQELVIRSRYRWKGEVQCDPEILMLAKTSRDRVGAVIEFLEEAHPYDLPEILSVDAAGGSTEYLAWVSAETAGSGT